MKVYSNLDAHPEVKALVIELAKRTDLEGFCGVPLDLPVHVHPPHGTPDLSARAVHVFPDGFADPTVHIDDPDWGSSRYAMVAGDCVCRSLYTGNWFAVEGRLTAELLTGHSGCNRVLVAGTIQAQLVLEIGHSFCADRMEIQVGYTEHGLLEQPELGTIEILTDEPGVVFHPRFVDAESEAVDLDALTAAFLEGEPWRAPSK
jgi:hypothetical protein